MPNKRARHLVAMGRLSAAAERRALLAGLKERNVPLTHANTSGHASIADLKRLASAVAPKMLVPIHTFEAARFPDHFANVERKQDGAWWEIAA